MTATLSRSRAPLLASSIRCLSSQPCATTARSPGLHFCSRRRATIAIAYLPEVSSFSSSPGVVNRYGSRWLSTLRGPRTCLLYTSDAADDLLCVDLGGRRTL